jgi:UDP:flavonoid glycosyltransferase YjiC (YdhE family)
LTRVEPWQAPAGDEAASPSRRAGLRLKPSAKPGAIAAAVRQLLDEPRHREGARRMAERLRAESARDAAADELEGAPRREAAAA